MSDLFSYTFDNPLHKGVYYYFATAYPKQKTDRISDLTYLLALEASFCLFSPYRNGTTTLLRDFTQQKNGIYFDAQSLGVDSLSKLEALLEDGVNPLVIDEGTVLFSLVPQTSALPVLYTHARRRQIGIRFHPEKYSLTDDFRDHGFEIVEMDKMPYAEFKEMIDRKMSSIHYAFPETYVQYAHAHYDCLALSLYYVGEAFRLLVQNSGKMPTEQELDIVMKRSWKFVKGHRSSEKHF